MKTTNQIRNSSQEVSLLTRIKKHPAVKISSWVILALLILLGILDKIVLPLYVGQRATLAVPNVVGLKQDVAMRILDSLKLEPRIGETRPDKEYSSGIVVLQNPLPMQTVKQGRRIYLTISGGEATVEIPALKGRSLRDAKFALERFALRLGTVTTEQSSEFPEGTIISQHPAPGLKVKRGTVISVVVSGGLNLDSLVVPTLTGKTLNEAQRIILSKKLLVGRITYQQSSDLLPNTILDQYPRGGEISRAGRTVDLFVSQAAPSKGTKREN